MLTWQVTGVQCTKSGSETAKLVRLALEIPRGELTARLTIPKLSRLNSQHRWNSAAILSYKSEHHHSLSKRPKSEASQLRGSQLLFEVPPSCWINCYRTFATEFAAFAALPDLPLLPSSLWLSASAPTRRFSA